MMRPNRAVNADAPTRHRFQLSDLFFYPWSAVVWSGGIVWMIFLVATSLPLTLFVPFERFQTRWPMPQIGWTIYLTFSRTRIVHDPRYRGRKGVVFVQNHVSVYDGYIACHAIRVPLSGLENEAHLKLPGYGWMMRLANAVPVGKGQGRFAKIATAMKERVSRGISVLTFPEAHRTSDGKVQPFKRGVFQIARDAGIPVVPLGVRGMYEVLPKGRFLIRPGKVEIYMGPEIETAGLTDAQLDRLSERVRDILVDWVDHGRTCGDVAFEPGPADAEDPAVA